jgi:hypothetical protein
VTSPARDPGPAFGDGGAGGRQRRRPRGLPILIAVLVLASVAVLVVRLTAGKSAVGRCESSFVPAFFASSEWSQASANGHPAVMILNPASGPGSGPDSALQGAVRQAASGGTHVIGYIGTEYGQRPLAQAERWVRDYRSWYGVRGIFLDQTPPDGTKEIGYYQTLAAYVRAQIPRAVLWLNPGEYPDQAYMSLHAVVMAFEGPYASYLRLKIPAWARHYPANRFAHTIYATPQGSLTSAVTLSRQRNADYVFVTDLVGANPYQALPDYWPAEQSAVAGGCSHPHA